MKYSKQCECQEYAVDEDTRYGHERGECLNLADGIYKRDGEKIKLCSSCTLPDDLFLEKLV